MHVNSDLFGSGQHTGALDMFCRNGATSRVVKIYGDVFASVGNADVYRRAAEESG